MKKYRIRLINPIFGVPVTFIEHYTPPVAQIGGYFGSEYTDSAKEQTTKTLEPTDDTTICDTSYKLLDCDSPVRGGNTVQEIVHTNTRLLIDSIVLLSVKNLSLKD